MKRKEFQIAHVWGMYCKKCKNIFRKCERTCPGCGIELQRVMSAFQTPKGCLFVYDDGRVPGGAVWDLISDERYEQWQEAINHPRPG